MFTKNFLHFCLYIKLYCFARILFVFFQQLLYLTNIFLKEDSASFHRFSFKSSFIPESLVLQKGNFMKLNFNMFSPNFSLIQRALALPICVYFGTSLSNIFFLGFPALLMPPVVLLPAN